MSDPFSHEALTRMMLERFGDLGKLGEPDPPAAEPAARASDYLALFATPLGMRVLTDLVQRTLLSGTWSPNVKPRYGFHREGQNSVIEHIISQMRTAKEGNPDA